MMILLLSGGAKLRNFHANGATDGTGQFFAGRRFFGKIGLIFAVLILDGDQFENRSLYVKDLQKGFLIPFETTAVIHIIWLWHNLWLTSFRNDNKKGENTF
jgi:hypothetical protein